VLHGRARSELEQALWDLVWAGRVTNDTFLPLRTLGAPRRHSAAARVAGTLAGGRWSLVAELRAPHPSATERAHAVALGLLERYGVVCRETALAEAVPGGFEALYPVLRALEERGRLRRGFFVEGLSGRQFALPGALERLREERPGDPERHGDRSLSLLLHAVDPANPWGALLPWPPGRRPEGPRPRRVAGAWVALRDGLPIVCIEAGGRSAVTLGGEPAALAATLRAARVEVAALERRRSGAHARIDGEPAGSSDLAAPLVELGAQRDGEGLRLVR
jgi:ATP-dependent Lhr-like helicase